MLHRFLFIGCLAAIFFLGGGMGCHEKPERLEPRRLYAIGDSISRGFDALYLLENAIGENLPMSWSTGFHGIGEFLELYPYIFSQAQRVVSTFGPEGVVAVNGAVTGASFGNGLAQAQAMPPDTTFVTVMLGANDVCRGDGNEDGSFDVDDTPSVNRMRSWVASTLDELEANLLPGATVMVVGIPDIKRFRDVAVTEKLLIGIDCPVLWEATAFGFPCGTMLSPTTTEASRLAVQERNFAYNDVLEEETRERNLSSERIYYGYVDLENINFVGDHISSLDCFHPSHLGQALISHVVWETGPFSD